MEAEKLQALLYDIQRQKSLDDAHKLIMKYADNYDDGIIVTNMDISYTGEAKDGQSFAKDWQTNLIDFPKITIRMIVPVQVLQQKTWTIENVLA